MIGFIHFIDTRKERPRPFQPSAEVPSALHCFDNGHTVTFADGTHNSLFLGTTGSGKTHSGLLPAFNRLVRAGFGVVVVE